LTAAATYHQVWWPPLDVIQYTVDRPPVWDQSEQSYVDPRTNEPLPAWEFAMAELSRQKASPAQVARLGTVDAKGIESGTEHADRAIRYTTKYITKDLVDQTLTKSDQQREHFDRLRHELAVLPWSPRCANWLV
jgi:hypothetical protein